MIKKIVLTFVLICMSTTSFAVGVNDLGGDKPNATLTAEDKMIIDAEIKDKDDSIKYAYDYAAASDSQFATVVKFYLGRYRSALEKMILVKKVEDFYTANDYIGTSALQELDALVKEFLGYNDKDVEKEISATQRVFAYDIYPVLFTKSGIQNSPYSGLSKFFTSVRAIGMKPVTTEEIPREIDKLLSDLKNIRDLGLKKSKESVEKVKSEISLKSSNYVSQSEIEREPLKVYSSPYKKEEMMRYAMAEKIRINNEFLSTELDKNIAVLEWMKENPGITETELNNTKIKIQAYRKYVHTYKAQTPANFLYKTWKTTESSGYMMAALAIQDLFLYKLPDVFLTEEKAAFYKQFTNKTFTQYMKGRFLNPNDLTAYKSFGAFVVTSHLIRALPAPKFVMKMSRYVDSKLWGVGGTRIRGLGLFAISMTVASKVSEAVSLYSQFSGELNFSTKDSVLAFINNKDNKDLNNIENELNSLAKDYISKSLFYSWKDFSISTGNFLISFAASEAVMKQLTGRLLPWGYYAAGSKLNKTKCGEAAKSLNEKIRKSKVGNTSMNVAGYTGNVFYNVSVEGAPMFLLATFIEKWMEVAESYFIDNSEKQKEMNEIISKMYALEYSLLGTGLKAYMNDPTSRVALYDKMDDLRNLADIVEYLRTNDGWVIGTMKKLLADATLDIVTKNKQVDDFLSEVFNAIKMSSMNSTNLAMLEAKYKANASYAGAISEMYSEENAKQLNAYYTNVQNVIKESGDSVIAPMADINPDALVAIGIYNQETEFMTSKFFNDIKSGVWGQEQKKALTTLMQKSHDDSDYQNYLNLYSSTIESALNASGTPADKLNNLFANIYPSFMQNPLMAADDHAEFEAFGEDLLDVLAQSLYSSFMQGVYTLPKDSDKYWTYMELVSKNVVKIGLNSSDYGYSTYAYAYLRLTMFFTLSAPDDMAGFRLYKEWKDKPENINKTYKDYCYEQWKADNPNAGDQSFASFAAKKWAQILHPVKKTDNGTVPLTDKETKNAYEIWKNKRKSHGL